MSHLKIGLLISVMCLLPLAFYFSNKARNFLKNEMSETVKYEALHEMRSLSTSKLPVLEKIKASRGSEI